MLLDATRANLSYNFAITRMLLSRPIYSRDVYPKFSVADTINTLFEPLVMLTRMASRPLKLAIVLACFINVRVQASTTLWFNKTNIIPIGNGRLGAEVFGQVPSEVLVLNEVVIH
ncbi:hypothetical protein L218DRAFT_278877 [Marasmius fiardii PR-910]|nr:hypothetical protein L218DRAFT_278877 [Marasmius fiardii PR-910]